MSKMLLDEQRDIQHTTVLKRLKEIVKQMEAEDYSEADAAVLITRDKNTGILTISHITEGGIDELKQLFDETARLYGYARVN